jgi:hypothetical protein
MTTQQTHDYLTNTWLLNKHMTTQQIHDYSTNTW